MGITDGGRISILSLVNNFYFLGARHLGPGLFFSANPVGLQNNLKIFTW